MKVGEKLKTKIHSNLGDILNSRGLKNKWVAEQIGATESQVANWSTNKNGQAKSTPHVVYVIRLEKLLGCTASEIFEEVEEE